MSAPLSPSAYGAGHPWYNVLGGKSLTPKQILADVLRTKYRGYNREEIAIADARCEPRRSQDLRHLRATALQRVRKDLAGYRRAIFSVHEHRWECGARECADAHVSAALKHNHVFNELAHLVWIDELLSQQLDLFEC